ncbi:MAG TPA: ABC transporter ATP-binding protein [Candidatus Paceibacterota bacterium]|nr:ABC transporter ATP-binding protein [Verrucomicrobiota bacterium]HRZ46644.1 ABC transporter ATP-binding protein [Candidatus Paceibacterota bacterium]HRZ91296.1 ABC transporter ATP-binding protein [Candidatus Paceibacterota bacterium]
MALLEIQDLQIDFGNDSSAVRAVDGVSFDVEAGETVGMVGESGCGKSASALAIARLLPSPPARYAGGSIHLAGCDVLSLPPRGLRRLRGRIVSYVFQEPASCLNPVMRIGRQIRESLRLHRPEADSDAEVVSLLHRVGIASPERRLRDYPHHLSGGMQQRVMIAMALASEPQLLVADEPTTALDVTIQAQILDRLRSIQRESAMSLLLISHNLLLVAQMADRVVVMYAGQVVETGPARHVLRQPFHPYTRCLHDSIPRLGSDQSRLRAIPGQVPQPGHFPSGCRFHPRCPIVQPDCSRTVPPLVDAEPGRQVRCPYALALSPPDPSP